MTTKRDRSRLILSGAGILLGIGTLVINFISGVIDDKKMEMAIEEEVEAQLDKRLGSPEEEDEG